MNDRNEFILHLRRSVARSAPYIARAAKAGSPNANHAEWIAQLKADQERDEWILFEARFNNWSVEQFISAAKAQGFEMYTLTGEQK